MTPSLDAEGGRVVWITGAAGGLGVALVEAFLEAGWCVAATGHRSVPQGTPGPRLWVGTADVTDSEAVRATVGAVLERWGRLDALVNNAGCLADASVATMTDAQWDRVLDVHLKGAFRCCREALPPMVSAGGGHILNVSSLAAREGVRGQANYAAAKAGLVGLTLSLAREVGPSGVCVNAVLPGMLPTGMIAGLGPEQVSAQVSRSVLGRLNELREPARFLAGLAALRHVSGQVFALDGRVSRWV
ncbi:MAG: SDR family NAD(P)-dependent oxidoreductase [Verrucomicrobiales bacterium]|nr:SDR family NAD(P)-dependent oxidoreductase [Verrucomicrobiales bacterium]